MENVLRKPMLKKLPDKDVNNFMQFNDLQKQFQFIKSDIHAHINRVLEHGQYILGEEVQTLETELAAYVGVKHCITVANGTDALMIAMMALGIKPGDEVITTPFTFIATAEMIKLLGAIPVFVDIDPATYLIDVNKIADAITEKTKCIMPVSLYGQCADMDRMNQIAKQYQIPVIEDAAQSFGATYQNKPSCSLTTIGCTSFFPSKPLGCYGDGGACFTNEDELASVMRQIRVHGQSKRYHHTLLGMNSRLDTVQAAILLVKLRIFDSEIKARRRIGKRYTDLLTPHVKTMQLLPTNTCVYAQYTIEVPERDLFQQSLKAVNIPTAVHYPIPLHLQPIFTDHASYHFPHAEKAAKHVMSLPMHPYLTDEDQDSIIHHVLSLLQKIKNAEMYEMA